MDQHFHFGDQPKTDDDEWAQRIGQQGAKIFFLGLAVCVALLLVAGGILAVKGAMGVSL